MSVSGARLFEVARINPMVPAPVRMNACNDGKCAARRSASERIVAASLALRMPAQKRFALSSASNAGIALPIVTLLGRPERRSRAGSRNWLRRDKLCYHWGGERRRFKAGRQMAFAIRVTPKGGSLPAYVIPKISMKG